MSSVSTVSTGPVCHWHRVLSLDKLLSAQWSLATGRPGVTPAMVDIMQKCQPTDQDTIVCRDCGLVVCARDEFMPTRPSAFWATLGKGDGQSAQRVVSTLAKEHQATLGRSVYTPHRGPVGDRDVNYMVRLHAQQIMTAMLKIVPAVTQGDIQPYFLEMIEGILALHRSMLADRKTARDSLLPLLANDLGEFHSGSECRGVLQAIEEKIEAVRWVGSGNGNHITRRAAMESPKPTRAKYYKPAFKLLFLLVTNRMGRTFTHLDGIMPRTMERPAISALLATIVFAARYTRGRILALFQSKQSDGILLTSIAQGVARLARLGVQRRHHWQTSNGESIDPRQYVRQIDVLADKCVAHGRDMDAGNSLNGLVNDGNVNMCTYWPLEFNAYLLGGVINVVRAHHERRRTRLAREKAEKAERRALDKAEKAEAGRAARKAAATRPGDDECEGFDSDDTDEDPAFGEEEGVDAVLDACRLFRQRLKQQYINTTSALSQMRASMASTLEAVFDTPLKWIPAISLIIRQRKETKTLETSPFYLAGSIVYKKPLAQNKICWWHQRSGVVGLIEDSVSVFCPDLVATQRPQTTAIHSPTKKRASTESIRAPERKRARARVTLKADRRAAEDILRRDGATGNWG